MICHVLSDSMMNMSNSVSFVEDFSVGLVVVFHKVLSFDVMFNESSVLDVFGSNGSIVMLDPHNSSCVGLVVMVFDSLLTSLVVDSSVDLGPQVHSHLVFVSLERLFDVSEIFSVLGFS